MYPPPVKIYYFKFFRILYPCLFLLFFVPMVATGHLWPLQEDGSIELTAALVVLLSLTVWANTTTVTYHDDALTLHRLGFRRYVQVSKMVRIEYYTRSFIGQPQQVLRLQDGDWRVVTIVADNYTLADLTRLAEALKAAVAASPGGDKKHFVALEYVQNKGTMPEPKNQ